MKNDLMKDSKDPLAACEVRFYCNENSVFPAMKYRIEELGMPVKTAAKDIEEKTQGSVSMDRASTVYRRRMGLINEGVSRDTPEPDPDDDFLGDPDGTLESVSDEISRRAKENEKQLNRIVPHEQIKYLTAMIKFLAAIKSEPPEEWDAAIFAKVVARAKIIIKRMEVFTDATGEHHRHTRISL